ncbi:GPI mannosyltransferase 4 [Anthonomus grandis grandis]|uniref:GPI mannosyltransferase 4 n=1 Tax=Anthonomus grandis grandis TaxID=2921223 RepID=UPI002166266E|nr:GPI mannosyltransferase 4 [Anthonomus grandis grandis]
MAKHKNLQKEQKSISKWIYGLGLLRIFLVLVPQTGYVHPDEYFQSLEVLAGKVFDVEYSPPWEFNTTQPIRGITIPYFTTGLSYIFLRDIRNLALEYLSVNVVTPYFLLVVPRLLVTVFSFIVDYCLMKICINNNEKFESRLIILGTSYIMLLYGTRTFSNTTELILFSVLLYFVCESQTFSNELLRKEEYIKYRYDKSNSIVEKAKFHKLKLYLVPDNYRNCVIIANITIFGAFNRPTFLIYAVMPVFFWIYRGTAHKRVSVIQFHTRILFLAICSIPSIIFNIIIDSFFYGYLTWGEIGMLEVSMDNFVVTPLNFIRYNSQTSNLARHGLHPRFLHLLVNIPLLFNIIGVIALFTLLKYIYWICQKKFQMLPSIRSIKLLMTTSFIVPVFILSIFPHQESRFLIPILLPLVYLHSESILPEPDNILVQVPRGSIEEKRKHTVVKKTSKAFKMYLFFNFILLGVLGFLHQGGVYEALNYLHKDMKFASRNTEFHILTSYMYSMPHSFLLQKSPDKVFSNNKVKYAVKKRVFLYEMGFQEFDPVVEELKTIITAKEILERNINHKTNYKIYIFIPYSKIQEAFTAFFKHRIDARLIDKLWPHFTTESIPDLAHAFFYPSQLDQAAGFDYLTKLCEVFELYLYELSFNNHTKILIKERFLEY